MQSFKKFNIDKTLSPNQARKTLSFTFSRLKEYCLMRHKAGHKKLYFELWPLPQKNNIETIHHLIYCPRTPIYFTLDVFMYFLSKQCFFYVHLPCVGTLSMQNCSRTWLVPVSTCYHNDNNHLHSKSQSLLKLCLEKGQKTILFFCCYTEKNVFLKLRSTFSWNARFIITRHWIAFFAGQHLCHQTPSPSPQRSLLVSWRGRRR